MEAATSQERDWSSLPADVLSEILSRIKWSGHPSFGLVCRQWQSARALSPFYPAWITPLLLHAAPLGTATSCSFRYYSPYYHKNFEIDTKLEVPPAGVKIFCATGGLHLTLGLEDKVVTADLDSGAVCELPPIPRPKFDFAVYDGVGRMYGVEVIDGRDVTLATSARRRNGEWKVLHDMDYNPRGTAFTTSPGCNPVLHDGSLYIMGTDASLVVYKGSRHGRRSEILEKPWGFGFKYKHCYLFESERSELMAAMVGQRGTPVTVVKLNKRTMEWEKMESLEGSSLFTGTPTTMMKRTNIKWMQGKVFLPILFDSPKTIRVDLLRRDNELAFVPKPGLTYPRTKDYNYGKHMWTCELGDGEEARVIWGAQRVDNSIWVDFTST
jgi:hypothetical protein